MNILIHRRWTLSKELNKYKMRRLRNKPRKAFCAMEVCFYYVGALSNWTGRWIILNWFTFTWLFRVVPAVAAELWGIVQLFRPPPRSLSLFNTLFIGTSQTVNLYYISNQTPVKAAYLYELWQVKCNIASVYYLIIFELNVTNIKEWFKRWFIPVPEKVSS